VKTRALLALFAAGCAHPVTPESVAQSYLLALDRGDVAAAYALSSEDVRSATVAGAFSAMALPKTAPTTPAKKITLELADGRTLVLVRESEAWRVRDEALTARLASDPRGAARAFLEAALAGDVARVRAFLPEDHAKDGTDILAGRLVEDRERYARAAHGLAAITDRAVVIEGDFASIPYDPRRTIRMIRQKGRWRVLDVE